MRFRRSRSGLHTGSLRRRVVLAVLGLLLVILVGVGLLVNVLLADRLRSDLHNRVADRAGFAQVIIDEGLSNQALTDRLTGQGIVATIDPGTGQVVVGRDQPGRVGPPNGAPPPRLRANASADVSIVRRGELYVATVTGGRQTVTITASLVDIDRTLSTLHRIELAAGAGTLLLAGLLLTVVIGLAMAPLTRMTRLARRIRDGARGSRLRPSRPTTDLGRTATAFDEMLDALERAEAEAVAAEGRMRQFLADASHDLRTPIAVVISTAEQVLRENPSRFSREQRLVSLIQQAQRAGRLVDDLMLMARLDDGSPALNPAEFDLAEVIEQLGFERPSPVWALADRDAVHRILANLLSNARRAGLRTTVTLRQQGFAAVVDVSDDGPGIPPADRLRIFERFVRLDGSRTTPGSGLGLPIALGLARSMQGELTLLDRAPGATFRLELPAASAQRSGGGDGDRLTAGHQLPVLLGKR